MPVSILVIYPKTAESKFDLDYYKNSHMPMVAKEFADYGFKGYRVIELKTSLGGGDLPYSVQCQLEFDTAEHVQQALGARGETVLGDVPNFSNVSPTLIMGDEVVPLTSS